MQQALGPGAIQNKLFRPLAELQMAAALSSTASTAELALKPVEKAPQTVKPTTPLQTATDKLSPTDAKRIAANRASLLSLAQDLRGMIQGRDADKALTGGVLKHPQ